jgi:2-methylisocitrate lyase-like PEP mutase family enzyme
MHHHAPARLRAALTEAPLVVPGCHDPLSARLAAQAGARAVFLSGGAVGRALFDAPMIPRDGWDTYLRYLRLVCESSPVPVIVDGEDGFGDPVATCVAMADAGAAGVIAGDGLPGGGLCDAGEFAAVIGRIRAATDVLFVARADGLAGDRAGTRDRLRRYGEAGAELTLPLMNSVLRTETRGALLATVTELAAAAKGTLAVHSRHGHELPPNDELPPGVRAVFVTAISLPPSTEPLERVLTRRPNR